MAGNYREKTKTRKRGRSPSKLSVRLFLLDPDKNITKVTKEIGSEKGLSELKQKGYGPPSKEYCVAGDKVGFSLELTNEEFKQKLIKIYPSLENACFMFMKAGKDNTLKELNPGVCCYRCYTPENVYFSERGQGKLYIQIIPENEISPCTHGGLRWKVDGCQQRYVPIAPKPGQTSSGIVIQTPLLSTASVFGPKPQVSLLEKSIVQGRSSATVFEAASIPGARSSGTTVIQRQLPIPSTVVSQTPPTPAGHGSIITNFTNFPSSKSPQGPLQPFNFANTACDQIRPEGVFDTISGQSSPNVSFDYASICNDEDIIKIMEQSTKEELIEELEKMIFFETPSLSKNAGTDTDSNTNMSQTEETSFQEANETISELNDSNVVSTEEELVEVMETSSQEENEFIPELHGSSIASTKEGLMEVMETNSQELNEANSELHGSNTVSEAGVSHASSGLAQSSNLAIVAEVLKTHSNQENLQFEPEEEQLCIIEFFQNFESTGKLEISSKLLENDVRFQENFETEQNESSIVMFLENVEPTGKLEISLDILNNDALLKKLNESTIRIHTVEIQSTCEVDQALKKFSLPSCLKVLRIDENNLILGQVSELVKFLTLGNLEVLDMTNTKFKENSFVAFICALYHCKDLTSLILTNNCLTEQEINSLIIVIESIKNLKIFNLSKCILTETQANAILHKHEQAKNIVSLDLSHNAIQGNEIVVGICQLQSLEELNLSHNCLRFLPFPNLEGKHNHLSTCLKKISSSSSHMKPDDISQFCSIIKSDVLKLNLNCNHVGHSIWSLCSLGEKIKHLKVLSLANADICDNVVGLVFLLSLVRKLEDLNLSSNNLMAEDFQQLQTSLSQLAQLKTLNLSMNAIGLDGIKALADVFKEFPLLERLDMSSSYIREDEVSLLCKSLVSLKKLKYLNLSGNCIDIEVLDDVLVLPATLEELLFSDVTHGEKLFTKMKQLQNLKKRHLNKLKLKRCDVQALNNMLSCFPKLEELSLAYLVAPECETILTAIKSLKNIKKINLSGIKLRNQGTLVGMLFSLKSLEELVLTYMSDTLNLSLLKRWDLNGTSGIIVDYEKLFSAIKLLKCLRKLSLGGVNVFDGDNAFFDMLPSLSILENIVFPNVSIKNTASTTGSLKALESLRYLRSLDLCSTIICAESTIRELAGVLPSLQLLEKLRLNFLLRNEDNESVRKLLCAFGKLKNLKVLLITDFGLNSKIALAEVLPSLQLLEKVDLDISSRDRRNKLLFDAIGKLRYLKELSIDSIENVDIEAFGHVLSSLPLLEKLSFKFGISSNTEYAVLYAAIGKLAYLRNLIYLSIYHFSFKVEPLAKVLPSLQLLEEQELVWGRRNELDSEHNKQLLVAISKLRYLKRLNFDCNYLWIGYNYFEGLGEMLTSLRLLEKLELRGLEFGNESEKKELLIAVGKLKCLKKLELRWLQIAETNVDALVKTLTSLHVLEEFTLWVQFYCKHYCDDDNCDKCRHNKYKPVKDLVKTKVLYAVRKLKYFKKFIFEGNDITKLALKDST